MSSYTRSEARATPDARAAAQTPPDMRLETFADWLKALDDHDWRGGIEATRKLRSMGISVVLCNAKPPGDRGAA